MSNPNKRIRIGRINYTNVWPIYYQFPNIELGDRVELISQVPTELNQAMAAGEIDMGPISSFAYGENFQQYLLYPDLSVSTYGKVNSILLFYKKPFEEICFGRIALPTTSATSVNLLKIIIEQYYGGKPTYSYAPPSLNEMMMNNDAALLIGDDAIRARWTFPQYEVMDLGERWTSLTGQWISLAVWAVRKDTAEKEPELVARIFEAFQKSKQLGLQLPDPMIANAQTNVGGSYAYWKDYFSNLCYDFGAIQKEGLQQYYQSALRLGLLDQEVTLQMWNNTKVAQVKQ